MADERIDVPSLAAEHRPALTVLIVNRNAASYLRACLESLRATVGALTVQVIMVDGDSTDDSVAVARSLWPEIEVIPVAADLGYVRGNNVGLQHARGRYTMYLNSDTVLYAGALQELVSYMDAHPDVGAASGAILNPDGSDQGVIRRFPTIMNGIFGRRSFLSRLFPNNPWYRHYMQSRQEKGEDPFQTEIISACSMVVRTDLLKQLGGMDEGFRFYWVDGELCIRIARRGYRIMCVPKARIMHHEGKGSSVSTFAKRLKMNFAFNHDAYRAYVAYHQLGSLDPRRLFARITLAVRTVLLTAALLVRPWKSLSSGGGN